MTQTADLGCRCGEVQGRVVNAYPATVNRVICYCDDCQAFLHHLGRSELLDSHGGSDIVQVAPATVSYHLGTERIACLRLTKKGLYRFYSTCCKTPLGNMVGTGVPFIGILANTFAAYATHDLDNVIGTPIGGILGKFAVGTPPEGSDRLNVRILARAIRMVLGWRLGGKAWPHPFFDSVTRAPKYPVSILSHAERESVRPQCGPVVRSVTT
jgi:hypothetical protein